MDEINRIPKLPSNLSKYFFGNDDKGDHLKLLATIAKPNAQGISEIQWGIFFTARDAKPESDTSFKGKVVSTSKKLFWKTKHSLWLIPISKDAKDEAIEGISAEGYHYKPKISSSEIIIRNDGANNFNWKDYFCWYDSKATDLNLKLSHESTLINLSEKGEWLLLQHESDTISWPVWIGSGDMENTDRQIVFSAPMCHIVNETGGYSDQEVWFGTFKVSDVKRYPFVSVGKKEHGIWLEDRPITWSELSREDVFIKPKELGADKTWHATNWRQKTPFEEGSNGNLRDITNSFYFDNTKVTNAENKLYSWLFIEGGNLYCIYIKHYKSSDGNGNTKLHRLLGNGEYPNYISTVQISRNDKASLFTRVAKFNSINNHSFADSWSRSSENIRHSLSTVQASSPVGLTPHIISDNQPYSYICEWSATYNDIDNYLLVSTILSDPEKAELKEEFNCATIALPFLRHQNSLINNEDLQVTVKDVHFSLAKSTGIKDNGTLFDTILSKYASVDLKEDMPIVLRDGALALSIGKNIGNTIKDLPTNKLGRFRLVLQTARHQKPFFLWQWYTEIEERDKLVVSCAIEDFMLPVTEVEAAGQDRLPGDRFLAPQSLGTIVEGAGVRNEPSLLIPLTNTLSNKSNEIPYFLNISESINVSQDHRLTMKLVEFNPKVGLDNSSQINAVILDSNPQFIGLIKSKILQQPGYDDGAWILAVREEEGGWRILDDLSATEGFQLVLPSQAIGEAYVKTDKTDSTDRNGEPEDNNEHIDYRFGAPTILRLSSERLDKRYVTAPWNLRKIWGQPGEVSPGIPLLEAQFELLYGLTGNLKPDKALIAELASKLGEVPVPPVNTIAWKSTEDQKDVFKDEWEKYVKFYYAWKSRLAILEPSVNDNFSNAKFTENLSYKPRIKLKEIIVNDKTDFEKVNGAYLRLPIPKENIETDDNAEQDKDSILNLKIKRAHDDNGLAGGFHYGFESTAIYREFWRESLAKGSSSAELHTPAFSSLGGWGKQIARFAADKTVIKSTTAMGRTHFYAVERIGRIGVYWNKAKHVIEYERTVVPTEQFKDQPPHSGRVLVRKVREYIEILEPTRRYPDFTIDAQDAPGSIMACTFKSKIIPVLSSWGHDVWGNNKEDDGKTKYKLIGWEVPLWKPGANPKVYIKPQIQLELMPPPDSDEKAILVNLSEPENLWFYTDTREKVGDIFITADVHKWPPVKDVDYTNMPEPEQYDIKPAVGDSPELLEATMPDVLDVFPGFERYTFKVDRNEIPAAVTSRYYPKSGITGRMRSVSMMRDFERKENWWSESTPATKPAKEALEKLIKGEDSLLANYANGFNSIEKNIRNGNIPAIDNYKTDILDFIKKNNINDKLKTLTNLEEPTLTHFSNLLVYQKGLTQKPTKWLWYESLKTSEGLVNRVISYYDSEVKKLILEMEKLQRSDVDFKDSAVKALTIVGDNITNFHLGIEFSIDSASSSILKMMEMPIDQIDNSINQIFKEISILFDSINLEKSEDEFETVKTNLQSQITAKINAIRSLLSKDFLKNLRTISPSNEEWCKCINSLETAIHDDLSVEGALLAKFEAATKKIIKSIERNIHSITEAKNKIYTTVSGYKSQFLGQLNSIRLGSQLLVNDTKKFFLKKNNDLRAITKQFNLLVSNEIKTIISQWDEVKETFIKLVKTRLAGETGKPSLKSSLLNLLVKDIIEPTLYKKDEPCVFTELKKLDTIFLQLESFIKSSLLDVFGAGAAELEEEIKKWLGSFDSYKRLNELLSATKKDVDAILRESGILANTVNQEFGRLAGEVAQKVKDLDRAANAGTELIQSGKQTLNNFRSVWEEFTAPGMGLNRKTIALIVKTNPKDVLQRLSITPCITRVKQLGQELEGLGLRAPATFITDRLLPAVKNANADLQEMGKSLLSNFDFSNLLSDLGGMRLDKLFPGFKMPDISTDKIKITQGFDKQNLTAWVNAEVDLEFSDKKVLMSYSALQVFIEKSSFKAKTRIEIDSSGKIKKKNHGELYGSWHIAISGTSLMIFRDTGVIFDNGKFTFDLDPRRMQMPGLLKLISEATQTMDAGSASSSKEGSEGGGKTFKVGLLKQEGIPIGIKASLDIPPTSISGGPSGISNLCFGGFFMLSFLDEKFKPKFITGVGFYVGTRETPFTLTIFILGGGGYIQYAMYFDPQEGFTIRFAMSVNVSATFDVSLGWMQGGLSIRLGLEGIYNKAPGKNSNSFISIFVEVAGHVEIIRLISVNLYLMLQATYTSGGGSSQLLGTGRLRVTIRVCRFITIEVEKSYSKVFSQSGSSSNKLDGPTSEQRADAILNSLN